MIVSAIIFDFDGTLTRPHGIDFAALRSEIGCKVGEPILEHIERLEGDEPRRTAEDILFRHEMDAARNAQPNDGAEVVVRELDTLGIPMAIITRNIRPAIERALENFTQISAADFRVIVTRDDGVPPKPDPAGVFRVADTLGVEAAQILCVGDYVYDVELARNAGCPSVFLTNGDDRADVEPDYRIERITELLDIVRRHQT